MPSDMEKVTATDHRDKGIYVHQNESAIENYSQTLIVLNGRCGIMCSVLLVGHWKRKISAINNMKEQKKMENEAKRKISGPVPTSADNF